MGGVVVALLALCSAAAYGAPPLVRTAGDLNKFYRTVCPWHPKTSNTSAECLSISDNVTHALAGNVGHLTVVRYTRRLVTAKLGIGALSVPGDFVETGVWRGGTSVILLRVLRKFVPGERHLWAADSFQGLPTPQSMDKRRYTAPPRRSLRFHVGRTGEFSASEGLFRKNLERQGFPPETTPEVRVLRGWFNESIPSAPIGRIAFLRLDGDLYESTMGPLESLYPKVVNGGFIYVDDYNSFFGCANAVDTYRKRMNITTPMVAIPERVDDLFDYGADLNKLAKHGGYEAVWWQKNSISG